MHRLSQEAKGAIVALRAAGKSFGKIAIQIGVPKSSCIRWCQLLQQRGSLKNKVSPGRPRKVTPAGERRIARLAIGNRKMSLHGITQQFNASVDEDQRISSHTVQRSLRR
jgi:transposase